MSPRILVIDDSENLRSVLRLTLEFRGHEVTAAADGAEALDLARTGGFDLIFCDIEMPAMNGIDFVRRYRADGGGAPIIMLSAESDNLLRQALAAGATDAIAKPFEPIALFAILDRHLIPPPAG